MSAAARLQPWAIADIHDNLAQRTLLTCATGGLQLQGVNRLNDKSDKTSVPQPPHPRERAEPLPWQEPKSTDEDADSARRLAKVLASRSYVPAVRDARFLVDPSTRGLRLQLDFLKPERLLHARGIEHTIVVFGSTRIVEPREAQRKLATLRARVATHPQDDEAKAKFARAERIADKSRYYDVARQFSQLVAGSSKEHRLSGSVIVTGGGPGIMEAANRGASDAGAETVGLNISLPHEQFPNPYVTPELCFQFHYFAIRKLHFLLRARALIAFPGGFGTLDEVFETLTLIQTRKIRPVPVVLVGEAYWRRLVDIDFMVDEGVIAAEDRELFWYAETAAEIWDGLKIWYDRAEI